MNYTRDIAFNVEDYIEIVISTTAEWVASDWGENLPTVLLFHLISIYHVEPHVGSLFGGFRNRLLPAFRIHQQILLRLYEARRPQS